MTQKEVLAGAISELLWKVEILILINLHHNFVMMTQTIKHTQKKKYDFIEMLKSTERRGHLTVNYIGTQSFITMLFYLFVS